VVTYDKFDVAEVVLLLPLSIIWFMLVEDIEKQKHHHVQDMQANNVTPGRNLIFFFALTTRLYCFLFCYSCYANEYL
jgi:hypothetical protein